MKKDKIHKLLEWLMTVNIRIKELRYTVRYGQIEIVVADSLHPPAYFAKNSKFLASKGLTNADILKWLTKNGVPNVTKPVKREPRRYSLYD